MRKPNTQGWSRFVGTRFAAVSIACATAAALQAANVTVSGVLKDQFYTGASRASVANGTATLTSASTLTAFEAPSDIADNYAQSVSGWFTPASTGKYVFFVSADDDADFYIRALPKTHLFYRYRIMNGGTGMEDGAGME